MKSESRQKRSPGILSHNLFYPLKLTLTGVIDDRYSIEREIGRGGMATVYLARDLRHGNRVALKILTSDFASMVSGERFTREIRITAALQHPHILPVFDSGQYNGHPYYVMPFVDGPTLSERIKKNGALAIDEALEIAGEVADALAHAHAEGIVHRDIKPSNILLAHGHAVVADFGVARAVETVAELDLTRTGIAVGTAAYMSPEQAAGEAVDGRSDVYSLGCVLYEMIAGHPPYTAANPRALMAKHWMDEIPSLRAVRSSVRSSIESLVRKAMAKRPAERFATAAEMVAAIRNVSTEERLAAIGFTPSDDQPSFSPPALTRTALAEIRAAVPVATVLEPPSPPVIPPTVTAPAPRRRIGRRQIVLAVASIAALGAAAWQYTISRDPGLDRNRVLIYPLLVPEDFKGSRNVGEDIGTMIGTALDGAGQLRWIDGWPLLAPQVRQNIRNLSGADARAIARSRGAAWYLAGRIVSRGDSSEVFLELNDVEGDSTVARGTASGLTSDAWRTGLHAVNAILPVLIPPGTQAETLLAEWTDRDPSAVASFLLGESAFRRVQLSEALQNYRDALKADSTFGLAAIRGAQAAAWNHRSDEAAAFIDAALQTPLSPRYAHFTRGYQAYLAGAADSAALELRRTIAIDPEMSAAWMQLGEVYAHLLPFTGNPDSLARAAFDAAFRVDSSAKNFLLHSIEIRLRAGDVEGAAPMVRAFLAADPDTILAHQVRVMYACARNGAGGVQWAREARAHPLAVLAAANNLKGSRAGFACAIRGYDAVMRSDTSAAAAGRRWSATSGLASAYVAQNRSSAAIALLDSSMAKGWGGGAYFLAAAPVYPEFRPRAREIAQRDERLYGASYATAPTPIRMWQLGIFESVAGRPDVAGRVAAQLADIAGKSGLSSDRRLARSLGAFNDLSRGDTARAAATLDSLIREPVPSGEIVWDIGAPRGLERLTLARIHAARGDYRKAIDIANVFDAAWPSIYMLYVPASLQLRIDAAVRLESSVLASRFRDRLATMRGEKAVAGK